MIAVDCHYLMPFNCYVVAIITTEESHIITMLPFFAWLCNIYVFTSFSWPSSLLHAPFDIFSFRIGIIFYLLVFNSGDLLDDF